MKEQIIREVQNNVINTIVTSVDQIDITLLNKVEFTIKKTLERLLPECPTEPKSDFETMYDLVNQIPTEYKWIARDKPCHVFWTYKTKPILDFNDGSWETESMNNYDDLELEVPSYLSNLRWNQSLTKLKPFRVPWHLAPEWAVAAAMDKNGTWNWLEISDAYTDSDEWILNNMNATARYEKFECQYSPKWKKSLILKPILKSGE